MFIDYPCQLRKSSFAFINLPSNVWIKKLLLLFFCHYWCWSPVLYGKFVVSHPHFVSVIDWCPTAILNLAKINPHKFFEITVCGNIVHAKNNPRKVMPLIKAKKAYFSLNKFDVYMFICILNNYNFCTTKFLVVLNNVFCQIEIFCKYYWRDYTQHCIMIGTQDPVTMYVW